MRRYVHKFSKPNTCFRKINLKKIFFPIPNSIRCELDMPEFVNNFEKREM